MNSMNFSLKEESKDSYQLLAHLNRMEQLKEETISFIDCARTLMIENNVSIKYWKEAMNTTVHTLNQVQLKKRTKKTPYELWYGYKPNVSYLKVFGSKCYILKDSRKESLYKE